MHNPEQWKEMMRIMKLDHIKAGTPNAFEASGGYDMIIDPYTDKTTNGLTRCIIDYLNFSGHWASRVNTQGQARVQKIPRYSLISGQVEHTDKVTWSKSTTRKGHPDISAIVRGRALKIEVKVGADTMREDQLKEQARIEHAGGLYHIATSFHQFLQWFNQTFGPSTDQQTNFEHQ